MKLGNAILLPRPRPRFNLIGAPVGLNAPNQRVDVALIQKLLNLAHEKGYIQPRRNTRLPENGKVDTNDFYFRLGDFLRVHCPQACWDKPVLRPNDPALDKLYYVAVNARPITTPTGVRASGPWQSEGPPPRKLGDDEMPTSGIISADICWELPEHGLGFVAYNRNDLGKHASRKKYPKGHPRAGKTLPDQVGRRETIDRIMTIAAMWYDIYSDRPLQIGDIAFPGGYHHPDHESHDPGNSFDMRPLRNDAQLKPCTWGDPSYNRGLTKEFIRIVVKTQPVKLIYFNDKQIRSDPEFNRIVKYCEDHNDHLHITFNG